MNIQTVEDLRTANPEIIRKQFSIVLERTVKELNSIPCIDLENTENPRQQIMASRSFGSPVTSFADISESVAYYATLAAEKLRRDKSVACSICVIVHTNSHQEHEPQYQGSLIVPLPQPSDSTMKLVEAALKGLKTIYRSGFRYKKSGVLLMRLQPKSTIQPTLFDDPIEQNMSARLMQAMDAINQKMGAGKLSIAASGICKPWAMHREGKSPNYTTDWKGLPEVA